MSCPFDSAVCMVSLDAAMLGLLTWTGLHRRTVRGDDAVLFLLGACISVYIYIKLLHPELASPILLSLLLVLIHVASASCASLMFRLSPLHPLSRFPGPKLWSSSSMILATVSARGQRHLVVDDLHKHYGDFVRIGPNVLSVTAIGAGKIVYGAAYRLDKSEYYRRPGHRGGVALFFKQKRADRTKRKRIWKAAFANAEDFFIPLENRTWQLVECLERRKDREGAVDLIECLAHWSYDVMGEIIYGGANELELMRDGDRNGIVSGSKQGLAMFDAFGHIPWLMDIVWHNPAGKEVYRLFEVAAVMMQKRCMTSNVQIRDLTSFLLEGDRVTGEAIPVSELEDDAAIATQSASDTTASAVSLILFNLLSHPNVLRKLQAILDAHFPDRTMSIPLTAFERIPYLDAVVNEGLRFSPPLFGPRVVPEHGVVIDNAFIPGGTIVAIAWWSQQTSASNCWPDPLEYLPERWMAGGLGPDSILNKAAFLPFYAGPFICPAKIFATQQLRLTVARLILSLDMHLASDFDRDSFWAGFKNRRSVEFGMPVKVWAKRREGTRKE